MNQSVGGQGDNQGIFFKAKVSIGSIHVFFFFTLQVSFVMNFIFGSSSCPQPPIDSPICTCPQSSHVSITRMHSYLPPRPTLTVCILIRSYYGAKYKLIL